MKVSRKSISRRIQEHALGDFTDYPSNVCAHFWKTVGALCVSVLLIFLYPIFASIALIGKYKERRRQRKEDCCKKLGKSLTCEDMAKILIKHGFNTPSKATRFMDEWGSFSDDTSLRIITRSYLYGRNNGVAEVALAIEALMAEKSKKVSYNLKQIFATYLPYLYWLFLSPIVAFSLAGVMRCATMHVGGIADSYVFLGLFTVVALSFIAFIPLITYSSVLSFAREYGKKLEDGIFIAYLKTIKTRICPLIEWVD